MPVPLFDTIDPSGVFAVYALVLKVPTCRSSVMSEILNVDSISICPSCQMLISNDQRRRGQGLDMFWSLG